MQGLSSFAPRPEKNWLWRRLYTYGATLSGLALLTAVVLRIEDSRNLMWVALILVARDAWRETLYIVAPSAEAIVSGIAAWRAGS